MMNSEDSTAGSANKEIYNQDDVKEECKPNLGCATTAQLIDELRARCEVDGTLDYKTVD